MPHFKPKEAGEKAAELAVQSRNPVEGKAGKYDVIFDPLAAAPILEQVGNAASMYAIESGTSFFEGRLNKKVGSDIVTIFDDGKLAGGIGSTAYDEEGIPSQKTTHIRLGVLRNYLHNTSTSRKYEVQTTGNAGLICPRPWNVVMDKGTYDINELIRQTKNGLYVTNMWYFEFQNEKTGEFSAMPRDAVFKIENGEITGAVTGLRLCDTIPNILNNVDGITEKREQISSWDTEVPVKCGHILVRGMTMTKSEDTPLEGRETV